jgi:hypothetical protein
MILGFLKTFSEKWRLLIISLRLFEDFFRVMEALIRNLRLFSKITTLRGFLKTFLMKLRFFFKESKAFFHYCGTFGNILRFFKYIFKEVEDL